MNDPQPPEGPRRGGGQVLLAGLSPDVRGALAERLPQAWFHSVADSGEAFAALPRRRWDAVVVDHQLPGGGGEDLVQELRAYSWGRAMPVLYCVHSTLPLETAHDLVHTLKVARLFFHPLDVSALAEQIASALPEQEPVRSAPRTAPELASAVAGIWEKFRGVTLQRVTTLEQAAVALLSGELSPELRRQAERDAHKLAGAVGTFGFAEASQLARSAELLLEGTRPLTPTDALTLSEWVNELRDRLEGPPRSGQAPSRPALRRGFRSADEHLSLRVGGGATPAETFTTADLERLSSRRMSLEGKTPLRAALRLRPSMGYEHEDLPGDRQRGRYTLAVGAETRF